MRKRLWAASLLASLLPLAATAQERGAEAAGSGVLSPSNLKRAVGPLSVRFDLPQADQDAARRRCPGCPVRRLVRPYLESIALNVMYNGINHARGHETALVGWRTWWLNLRHGFEWDDNPWGVNQIGHPYQGSNYFTSGRAHGLSFWESTAVAAFGSSTWEFLAENNRASLNDLINTTIGGIALGEVMHRIGWLIRDPTLTGGKRKRQELIATAIDPMSGLQRFMSGDAKRVSPRPPSMIPSSITYGFDSGVAVHGRNLRKPEAGVQPFLEIDMDYGDVRNGRSIVPFGAFALGFQSGAGNYISEVSVRGRYVSRPLGQDKNRRFFVFQTFDYIRNRAYAFGGQGVEVEVALIRPLSPVTSMWLSAAGGSTILGAVNTLADPPQGATVDPDLLKRREYDYGPTIRWGGVLELHRDKWTLVRLAYQGYQLNVVDGARSFHVLQRWNLDFRLPVSRAFAIGLAGEYFFRKAYFWPAGNRVDKTPQLRVFLSWRQGRTAGGEATTSRQTLAAEPIAVRSGQVFESAPEQVPTQAPVAPVPQSPAALQARSKRWIVGGGGFSMARAGCADCSRSGVFTNSKGFFFDVGGRVSPRVDAGVELLFVRARLEDKVADPILTTFILGIGQFRPWLDRGLYLRAGMGLGIAGNGLYSPFGPRLAPPYSTNALGVTYGIGWIFRRERRVTVQAAFSHHIAALGELATVSGETVRNVVGNYWTSGMAIVIR